MEGRGASILRVAKWVGIALVAFIVFLVVMGALLGDRDDSSGSSAAPAQTAAWTTSIDPD